jgi:hypothetical protein
VTAHQCRDREYQRRASRSGTGDRLGHDPLKTGQVDVITGWVIDAGQMASVGPEAKALLLWDMGIPYTPSPQHDRRGARTRSPLADFLAATRGAEVGGRSSRRASTSCLVPHDLKRDLELRR